MKETPRANKQPKPTNAELHTMMAELAVDEDVGIEGKVEEAKASANLSRSNAEFSSEDAELWEVGKLSI